ncbi:uncharacterized protein CANTADRAFT_46013 [Suhomyces tanzawaensis NRRL Y-17324]|uniref:RRM domain-containing protein n=1 Tax=Suhomyces tanzawaensis NRRL Y-17324 TaxID=984487 RepID=A0A1E4SQT5_9ASCO|nr:uncharacterized protein CANTADRAFT_46013 [Suhomyces tanzawaensis NRRL Y-17324]ODV81861.1 hypothetical protein CANTADRAFT_46013 [Suhomyces tanzawaensis NRRL Y-17324]
MAPPKKGKKMDIGDFLADDSLGGTSWADEEVDMTSIGFSAGSSTAVPVNTAPSGSSGFGSGGFERSGQFEERRERKEYPMPDAPPYRARVANLPWEVDEDAVARFFENRMQITGAVQEVKLPLDRESGRPRGTAFVTFSERSVLEEALNMTMSDFNGRKVFVNVAAPQNTAFDGDWRSSRSGPLDGGREEPELDWGAARGQALPPRERSNRGFERADRGERPPRPEEPDLDWGAARSTRAQLPPRERRERPEGEGFERTERPKRDEPELDWGSARGQTLPPRERSNRGGFERGERPERTERPKREEPELDWGSARGQTLPPRERSNRGGFERAERPKKDEPVLDWSRGQALPPRAKRVASTTKPVEKKDEQPKPQKSAFSVLALEGESDDEAAEQEQKPKEETKLETAAANLSIQDDAPKEDQGWEVVGK